LISDEIYPVDMLTTIYLTGHRTNVLDVAQKITDYLEEIKISVFYLSYNEAYFLLKHISQIKNEIHPAEIRISKESIQHETNHPFYFVSCHEKKVLILGKDHQIESAEQFLDTIIK